MRTELLIGCENAREARKLAPWAAVVRRVDGGYMAWECIEHYRMWMRQK